MENGRIIDVLSGFVDVDKNAMEWASNTSYRHMLRIDFVASYGDLFSSEFLPILKEIGVDPLDLSDLWEEMFELFTIE